MGEKIKYYRSFLLFEQEDAGYGNGPRPSGYVKIEVREGKGKLSALVQNLKDNDGGLTYKLYLLKCEGRGVSPLLVGSVLVQKGKGELQWEFDPDNICGTGFAVPEFSVAVVAAGNKDKVVGAAAFPMVAYRGAKVEWKGKMIEALNLEAARTKASNPPKDGDKKSSSDLGKQSYNDLYTEEPRQETLPSIQEAEEELGAESEVQPEDVYQPKVEDQPYERSEVYSKYEGDIESKSEVAEENFKSDGFLTAEELIRGVGYEPVAEGVKETFFEQHYAMGVPGQESVYGAEAGNVERPEAPMVEEGTLKKPLNCVFGNPTQQPMGMRYNPCINCFACGMKTGMNRQQAPQMQAASDENSIEKLRKGLERYFEHCDPFGSKRRDYKWWKVNSPVYLNNILYQCGINSPLLFNPAVMMSHFKYRHLIIGIYTDRLRRRQYIVCGVPGVYSIDEKPFGDMCMWVQLEGSKPKYGTFGYWLVYIDPMTGKFLSLR